MKQKKKKTCKVATAHVRMGLGWGWGGSGHKLVNFISWIQTYLSCAAKNFNSLRESTFFFFSLKKRLLVSDNKKIY